MFMPLDDKVSHTDLAAYADDRVNLKRVDVDEYRNQVNNLRDQLAKYIEEHPGFDLVKMLHSGSVAKGTALSTINDMDVAVYVERAAAPEEDEAKLLNWLTARLREAYGKLKKPEDFTPGTHCVTVKFHGSGLDVDVVPVLYEGDVDDKGYLITKDTGDRVLTSIPLHLAFTRSRKDAHPHYAQLVRFVKWWKRAQEIERGEFRFKSFMIEMVIAHLVDTGVLDDVGYPEALARIFAYIQRTEMSERIVFTDHYDASEVGASDDAIQIFDPVNPKNNVASGYSANDRDAIVDAAADAVDAIAYARRATTKSEAESAWRDVFGPSFKVP